MGSKIRKGTFLGILAATLWGVGGTLGQYLFQDKDLNVEWLITIRLLVSGIGLLLLAMVTNNNIFSIWTKKQDVIRLLVFSIVGMLGVQYTYFAAIKYSNAATATVLQFAGPILIAAYLALKFKRVPKKLEFLALLLALIVTSVEIF